MDIVFVRQLEVDAIIGIYDFERETPQPLVIDLDMGFDIGAAANSENINDALNYKTLTDDLREFVAHSKFLLIETLAEKICEMIQKDFAVQWVKLTLHKPNALSGNTDVGLIIERGQKS